jgi:hypothetical protein
MRACPQKGRGFYDLTVDDCWPGRPLADVRLVAADCAMVVPRLVLRQRKEKAVFNYDLKKVPILAIEDAIGKAITELCGDKFTCSISKLKVRLDGVDIAMTLSEQTFLDKEREREEAGEK